LKIILTVLASILGIAGCGSDASQPANATDNSSCAPTKETTLADPGDKYWMHVTHKAEGRWHFFGKEKTDDELQAALQVYSKINKKSEGLTGRDNDDISHNPVVFAFESDAPAAKVMFDCAVHMVGARMYKIYVELHLGSDDSHRCKAFLPLDEGLPVFGEPAKPQPIVVSVRPRVNGEFVEYQVYDFDKESWQLIPGSRLKVHEKYTASTLNEIRNALQDGLKEMDNAVDGKLAGIEVEIKQMPELTWGYLFPLLECVERFDRPLILKTNVKE
jgi:hypothetical protein